MSAYLDASVLLPTLIKEQASPAVDAYLDEAGQELLISDFVAAEVASALSRLVRTGSIAARDALTSLDDFDVWRAALSVSVDFHPADLRLAYAYVRRFDLALRAPDALHLAIASRLDATLVTLDLRMAAAAQNLGIPIVIPKTGT